MKTAQTVQDDMKYKRYDCHNYSTKESCNQSVNTRANKTLCGRDHE